MNQIRDIVIILIVMLYHLTLFFGVAYLVYYKDASAWLFLMPLFLTMKVRTKD